MQVRKVLGKNVREALERARDMLGAEALVVGHRAVKGGGVSLALTEQAPRNPDALARLREEAKSVLEHGAEGALETLPRPGTSDVERSLVAQGASRWLIQRVTEAVESRLTEGTHPLDLASEELPNLFPVAHSRRSPDTTTVMAFVGPTGAGKTTCCAKLSRRLRGAGRRVVLATTDGDRVGALGEIRAHARAAGCPVAAIREPELLAHAIERQARAGAPRPDVVLVDTSGREEVDADTLRELDVALELHSPTTRLERYLVVSAASTEEVNERFADSIVTDGSILTKLDETDKPARALELAARRELPIAFLSDGPDLDRDLYRPTPDRLADLMLRGRIA